MTDFSTIIRSDLRNFAAYRATSNREQLGNVWLNANESPYHTSMPTAEIGLNRYPQRWPQQVLTQLAEYYDHNITPQQLLLSRGSDEAIDLLIRLCCRSGQDSIVICPPTFHIYSVYAELQGASVVSIPLDITHDFQLPVDAILQQWQPHMKLIFICSPNNPTGNAFAADDITRICEAVAGQALVIVDEAYQEFSTLPSLIPQLAKFDNLVILRTLSKGFGLAGVRCGVTIAHQELIEWLRKISSPYPLPTPCIAAILDALTASKQQKMRENLLAIKQAREHLQHLLASSPHIKQVWPTQTNFLLLRTTNAEQFIKLCLAQGIIIRDYSKDYGLENCVRITIGTPDENSAFLTAIATTAPSEKLK